MVYTALKGTESRATDHHIKPGFDRSSHLTENSTRSTKHCLMQAVYTALKETESRATDLLPVWKVPLFCALVPRQRKATAAVDLIRRTTEDLIARYGLPLGLYSILRALQRRRPTERRVLKRQFARWRCLSARRWLLSIGKGRPAASPAIK